MHEAAGITARSRAELTAHPCQLTSLMAAGAGDEGNDAVVESRTYKCIITSIIAMIMKKHIAPMAAKRNDMPRPFLSLPVA